MDDLLRLTNITKSFSGTEVLKGISLSAGRGEFITLLGPSGCGKTTTLRIIAGLETPDAGTVLLEEKDVTAEEPNKRDVNTVFQNYALFPHMNVENNIGYGLKIKKAKKEDIRDKVKKMLELVQLEGFEKRMPGELSGGQKQRVAIARALINEPKLLLLDEPLGALDLKLRRQMQIELKRLQKKLGITFIYITHDQEEALNMSDRIAVMDEGQFVQIGSPADIYDRPETSYVAGFVGNANVLHGSVTKIEQETVFFQHESGMGSFLSRGHRFVTGMPVTVAIRGEQTTLGQTDPLYIDQKDRMGLHGIVKEKSFSGGMLHIVVELANGEEFTCNRHGIDFEIHSGDKAVIGWLPEHCIPVDLTGEQT